MSEVLPFPTGKAAVPESWKVQPLSRLCAEIVERVDPAAMNGDLGRHYIGLEHIGQGTGQLAGLGNAAEVVSQKSRFRAGDILYGKLRPNLRKVAWPEFGGVCSTDIIVLRAKPRVDPAFLFQVLQSEPLTAHAIATAAGTKMPRTHARSILSFEIATPPLDEQRRIAEVLRSVDEAIAAADAAQEAAQQVFIHLRAELVEGARQCFDEILVANAIAKNRGEKLIKLQTSDYQDVGAFPIIDQGASFICGYTDDHSALWPYSLPVIVFGDHTRILKFIDFPFAIGADGTQCLTPTADLDARFLYFALQSLDLRGEGYARHFKLLKEKAIPLPDMPTQLEIANQLLALEQSMAAAETVRQRLQQTKRALMSDLLSGRVRVPA